MPRAKQCAVCAHPKASDITRELIAGGPKRVVADAFGLPSTTVQRHRENCLRMGVRAQGSRGMGNRLSVNARAPSKRGQAPVSDRTGSQSGDGGVCPTCQIDLGLPNPENLIRRADRIARLVEQAALRASGAEQERLLLISADRVTKALETLLKARSVGGFAAAQGVNVNINGGSSAQLASVSDLELSAMISKLREEVGTSPAIALPSGDGVPIEEN
jgi:hypothetical protein